MSKNLMRGPNFVASPAEKSYEAKAKHIGPTRGLVSEHSENH